MPVSRSSIRAAFAVGASTEHDAALVVEVVGGGGEHAGLAGTGRTDDEHEAVVAGDGGRRLGLHHVESGPVDGGGRCRRVGLGRHRPGDDVLLLGEHRLGGEAGSGRFDPHRPAIRRPPLRVARWVEVDQVLEHPVGGSFDGVEPAASRHLRHGSLHVADRLDHVGTAPRRAHAPTPPRPLR